jgi:hypothetical protein
MRHLKEDAMSRLCRLSLAIAVVLAVPAPAAVAGPRVVQASGLFTVAIDPASVTAQPLPGGRCRITPLATFTFTGDLHGAFKPPAAFEIMKVGVCDPAVPALETFVARGTFEGRSPGCRAVSGSCPWDDRRGQYGARWVDRHERERRAGGAEGHRPVVRRGRLLPKLSRARRGVARMNEFDAGRG